MRILPVLLLAFFLFSTVAYASDSYRLRYRADSDFRIAEKAYRKAVRDYGENLTGMPTEESTSACRKIRSALYTNRWQRNYEDAFTQQRYGRQVQKLENYNTALGCP